MTITIKIYDCHTATRTKKHSTISPTKSHITIIRITDVQITYRRNYIHNTTSANAMTTTSNQDRSRWKQTPGKLCRPKEGQMPLTTHDTSLLQTTNHGKGSIAETFTTISNRESTTHRKKTTTPACMQSLDTW